MTAPAGPTDRLELVELLLRRGGEVLLAARNLERTIQAKRSAFDIVTDADHAAEEAAPGSSIRWTER